MPLNTLYFKPKVGSEAEYTFFPQSNSKKNMIAMRQIIDEVAMEKYALNSDLMIHDIGRIIEEHLSD